jgi:U3 small nucleolar RNA-associated protein 20
VQNAGTSTVHEVMTGLIQRLCDEVDPKELPLIYSCLFEEINDCLRDGSLEHLKCLIDFLAFALHKKQSNVFGQIYHFMFHMLSLHEFIVTSDNY